MGKKKAGCVPVRRREGSASGEWEVLLVESRWTSDVWLFPKGGVEPGESGKAAAVRETVEEAGVVGDLGPKLGSWTFDHSRKQKQKVWLLYVTTEYAADSKLWKERKKRLRAWHTFDSARRLLTDLPEDVQRPQLLEILLAAERAVKGGSGKGIVPADLETDSAEEGEGEGEGDREGASDGEA